MIGDKLKNFLNKGLDEMKVISLRQPNYINQMPEEDLVKLLQTTELHYFLQLSPDISHKKVLILSYQTTNYVIPKLLGKNPALIVNYQKETKYPALKKNVICIKGGLNPIALKSQQFEVAYYPLATRYKDSFSPYMKELSRVVSNKGRIIISVIHPQLEWVLKNQNPNSTQRVGLQITDYVKLFKNHNLYVENMEEVVVNEKTKPFFTASKLLSTTSKHYQEFQGMPLIVMFSLIKFKKSSIKKKKIDQSQDLPMNDQNQKYLKNIYGL